MCRLLAEGLALGRPRLLDGPGHRQPRSGGHRAARPGLRATTSSSPWRPRSDGGRGRGCSRWPTPPCSRAGPSARRTCAGTSVSPPRRGARSWSDPSSTATTTLAGAAHHGPDRRRPAPGRDGRAAGRHPAVRARGPASTRPASWSAPLPTLHARRCVTGSDRAAPLASTPRRRAAPAGRGADRCRRPRCARAGGTTCSCATRHQPASCGPRPRHAGLGRAGRDPST